MQPRPCLEIKALETKEWMWVLIKYQTDSQWVARKYCSWDMKGEQFALFGALFYRVFWLLSTVMYGIDLAKFSTNWNNFSESQLQE